MELCGGNAKRVVFGTLSLTGHRLFLVRDRQRASDFQEFLKLVHDRYRGWSVLMLLDGDSSHTAGSSVELAAALDITLEWLPVRSPELNAIEDLWGDGKEVVCANHQYPDVEEQTEAFLDYVSGHTNHQAQRKTGLLNDDYWLFE